MRIAIIAAVAICAMAAAAYFATREIVVEQKPVTPPPAFVVETTLAGIRPSELEQRVAVPLEKALLAVPGVTRVRTRIFGGRVSFEVWAPADAQLGPALAPLQQALPKGLGPTVVRRVDPKLETYWLVKGDGRPKVDGVVCGPHEGVVHVRLDPLKLQQLHVSALDVDRALKAAAPLEELMKTVIVENVKLADVAVGEAVSPQPGCSARTAEGPTWFVRTLQQELGPDARRLEAPARVELDAAANVPVKLGGARPAVTTFEPPRKLSLWFSPAPSAAERQRLLQELRATEGVRVRHVDGLPRVRLVLTGVDRDQLLAISGVFVDTVPKAKGVELFVPPPASRPFIDAKVDQERAGVLGVSLADIEALIQLALHGSEHDGLRVAIELDTPEQLGALYLNDKRLDELVTMNSKPELPELLRENGRAAVELVAYGIDRKQVPRAALPGGVTLEIHEEL